MFIIREFKIGVEWAILNCLKQWWCIKCLVHIIIERRKNSKATFNIYIIIKIVII